MSSKLERMYEQLSKNSDAINNGGSKFLYTKRNEELSKLIAKEEAKKI